MKARTQAESATWHAEIKIHCTALEYGGAGEVVQWVRTLGVQA